MACGYNRYGQIGNNNNEHQYLPVKVIINESVKSIHSGCYNAIAISKNNSIFVWGSNYYGQLPTITNDQLLIPTKITLPNVNVNDINIISMYYGCWLTTSKYYLTTILHFHFIFNFQQF